MKTNRFGLGAIYKVTPLGNPFPTKTYMANSFLHEGRRSIVENTPALSFLNRP